MAARYLLYGVLALAIATAIWVGLRRLSWDAAYQTVGLVIPAQELDSSLGEDELRNYLKELRAQGVVAVSVELAAFPDWNLTRVSFDENLSRVVQLAQAVGLGVALVADADLKDVSIAELERNIAQASIRPKFWVITSDDGAVMPSWVLRELRDAMLGVVEFSEPSRLLELYRQGQRNFVRIHAIKSRELDRLGLEGALARWERAVWERTIRLLWVTEHQKFSGYVERLSRRIAGLGMNLGQPSAPAPFESSYLIYLMIGMGFVSFGLLVVTSFTHLQKIVFLGYGFISLGLAGLWDLELVRGTLALVIASLAPWLLLLFWKEKVSGWKLVVMVSLGSSGAGLAVAALLSDLSYFLKLNEFRGVKLALIAPPLLISVTELWRSRDLGWDTFRTQLKRGAWLIPAVGLGALFLVLERSGNLPVIPAARWEETLRERLEDWLTARPRFKEFLVGHPALVLCRQDRSLLNLSLLALGALGQASIINTFVHLHTPVGLSLWRTVNGLALGLFIGALLCSVLSWMQRWRLHRS